MGRGAVLPWPPPNDVFWMCPNCGPADYTVVRQFEPLPQLNTAAARNGAQRIMDMRVVACSRCGSEHLTTYYRDGQVRITEASCPTVCGFFEYSAADGEQGGWRDKRSSAQYRY